MNATEYGAFDVAMRIEAGAVCNSSTQRYVVYLTRGYS
jgi:hypothetical protein